MTILFCDLVDSTGLAEGDPEAYRRVQTRFFDRMREIVERHGGTVEKFIGDEVMAVFGVPAVHEDDALRAVRAAQEMQEALPELGPAGGGSGSTRARCSPAIPSRPRSRRRRARDRGQAARTGSPAGRDRHRQGHVPAGQARRQRRPAGAHPRQGQGGGGGPQARRRRRPRGAQPGAAARSSARRPQGRAAAAGSRPSNVRWRSKAAASLRFSERRESESPASWPSSRRRSESAQRPRSAAACPTARGSRSGRSARSSASSATWPTRWARTRIPCSSCWTVSPEPQTRQVRARSRSGPSGVRSKAPHAAARSSSTSRTSTGLSRRSSTSSSTWSDGAAMRRSCSCALPVPSSSSAAPR